MRDCLDDAVVCGCVRGGESKVEVRFRLLVRGLRWSKCQERERKTSKQVGKYKQK